MTAFSLRLTQRRQRGQPAPRRDRQRQLEGGQSTTRSWPSPTASTARPGSAADRGAAGATSAPTSTTSTRGPTAAGSGNGSTGSPRARAVGRAPPPEARARPFRPGPAAQPVRPPRRGAIGPGRARGRRSTRTILTIGFARRFATYKRAGLLFSDIDRLAQAGVARTRPIQVVFAGKAHPADRPGQKVIQEIFQRSRSSRAARPGLHPRGLRHARRAVPGPGRRTSG